MDVRIIAATHRNLEQRIAEGTFREDLFYRLNVFPIRVPPLRERAEDIPLLVWRFVDEFSKSFGKRIDAITEENMAALQQYAWPGNIRELRNVVERAMIVAAGPQLTIALPTRVGGRRTTVQRQDGRRREGAHPQRARELRLAHPGRGRRGGAARAPAHHARNPHGQARAEPARVLRGAVSFRVSEARTAIERTCRQWPGA